ncbi:galactitol-1-phosphate 5-dehydrogenase [Sediminibacillus sp. JSM 1682029]|uniref:galactitol-1-phosphate 5-dehydrogenase n=1 Tax=Sediminibacillus sp. JSM 1682029 TaxID=3229857 RepID=UPI00352442B2
MKALNLYGVKDIRCEQSPEPVIEDGKEVIIKVKAAGICGSDISRYQKLGPYVKGMTFGHEFSGEVVETGEAVTEIKTGDRVAACPAYACGDCESCRRGEPARCAQLSVIGARHPGAYAEFVKLPAGHVMRLPDNVDYDTAALVEPASVVAHGYYRTDVRPGAEVAVMGAGNIGLLAIQWARIFGARKVYAIDVDDQKLEIARELGADVTVNPLVQPADEQIMEQTGGRGVDLAVESAGSPATSAQVLALPRKGGEVVFLGIPYADVTLERDYFEKIVRNELRVLGSWNAVSAPFPGKEWTSAIHYMSSGAIQAEPMISHRLQLEEGPGMFQKLVNREEQAAKVLFYPDKE